MKKKISHLIGGTLLCSILAINMLATPKISFAIKENVPKGIEFLKNNTLYKYDLNGDNKVDEIKVKQYGETDTTLKLYINNKLCLTKKSDLSDGFGVQVCDLDKKDNYLDLFIFETAGNDCILDSFFVRYNGKALDPKIAFKPKDILDKKDAGSYKLVKLSGSGKFCIRNYTDCNAIGSFNCYMTFQLKDKAITAVPEKTFKISTCVDKYKVAKSFRAYEKAGSKKVVYSVKKGNKVTFDKLYISKSGIGYLRMINSKGKIGWIRCDQKGLFTNAFIAG